ncbi:efflux RND transporter permease subunit [uncultured Thiocystis sp.]|uniref:efflux RND transporter permease subunit n=1 Tax=uncultured Thiocystis sp. TaxID=1202134 RepID=UPI00342076BA
MVECRPRRTVAVANSRHAIGTGVMGGMVGATLLGVLFVPIFYVVVRRLMGPAARYRAPALQIWHRPRRQHSRSPWRFGGQGPAQSAAMPWRFHTLRLLSRSRARLIDQRRRRRIQREKWAL